MIRSLVMPQSLSDIMMLLHGSIQRSAGRHRSIGTVEATDVNAGGTAPTERQSLAVAAHDAARITTAVFINLHRWSSLLYLFP